MLGNRSTTNDALPVVRLLGLSALKMSSIQEGEKQKVVHANLCMTALKLKGGTTSLEGSRDGMVSAEEKSEACSMAIVRDVASEILGMLATAFARRR